MSRDIDADLRALRAVAPPPDLDAWVKSRAHAELVARSARARDESARVEACRPARLPEPERWVYALAVLMYGGRALSVGAQLLWRAALGY